ncbi:MAG TPA: SNF2-related protein [Kiritimatiellia bacterium]|nr:SNF2-related protein [Kiritimatiellia bacterium]HMP34096.1 SNF2-related protein [Kiritimatiellia bacterium]
MPDYRPGQRWISETEPELGLGRVTATAAGRVELAFPASGETRLYAADHAPLKRVLFHPGDRISDAEGQSLVIATTTEQDGCRLYADDTGRTVHERDLRDAQTFDRPEARLQTGHADPHPLFDLRRETLQRRADLEANPVRGLLGGRIDLIPHQVYIAAEVSRRDVPRILLADEVGLGKTIEACLILHRMLITGRIHRALILVPGPLVHQWFVELIRRFNLPFTILDEPRCATMQEDDDHNPFLDEHRVICATDFLLHHPDRAAQLIAAGWDLLIVDEAHHLTWHPDNPSPAYRLVEALAQATPSVILLTATPEQLGPESHFARLRLLDPHRYHDLDAFLEEHARYAAVAAKTNALIASGDEAKLQHLLDQHGPGRVMFRNTRATMKGFPKRHLHRWPLKLAPGSRTDPRVAWLAEFLRTHEDRKVLVITQTKEEVLALQKNLQALVKVNTALFHEDMPLIQCDRQAAWFAEPDGARLLIASEIGGEGRNFQFVQHLVLIHLPDDPEMLEQRIGRLDRIGQSGDIHIHVPVIEHSVEDDRLRWFHEGLNAFEEALSGAHEIMERFRDRLKKIDAKLIAETRAYRLAVRERIERGRDRLLELNSCRPAVAAAWIAQIDAVDRSPDLAAFLGRLCDHFGVNPEPMSGRDLLIQRTHLFDQAFPLGPDPLPATYDRKRAMAREDMALITWDHPMVRGAIDLLLGSESGNAALAVAPSARGLTAQAVFVVTCIAPPALELGRFLPPSPVTVTVGARAERPAGLREPKAWETIALQPAIRAALPDLLERARDEAERQLPGLVREARRLLDEVVGGEARRLAALRKINDHIRDDELEAVAERLTLLRETLATATLRLDSILLITPPPAA